MAGHRRGVENVRELREGVKYAPATARFKIYIIDEVHMLSTQAFNALLKTLEEPPAHVKFMFATTDPEKVLPTILSRCQRFDLRRIPSALIVKHLQLIAEKEKVKIDDAALFAIARGAETVRDRLADLRAVNVKDLQSFKKFRERIHLSNATLPQKGRGGCAACGERRRSSP